MCVYVYIYIHIHSFIRINFACKTILMFRKHPSANPEASEPEERVPMQLLRAPLKEGVRVEAALLFSGKCFPFKGTNKNTICILVLRAAKAVWVGV